MADGTQGSALVSAASSPLPQRPEVFLGRCLVAHLGDQLCLTPLLRLLTQTHGSRVCISHKPVNRALFEGNSYVAGCRVGRGIGVDRWAKEGTGHVVGRLAAGFRLRLQSEPRPEMCFCEEEVPWANRKASDL